MIGSRTARQRPAMVLATSLRSLLPGRQLMAVALAIASVFGLSLGAPQAAADPCPDVEVVFARGTFEPDGIGVTGQAFVDSLRSKVGSKSVEVYGVNYPASLDFNRAADGVIDASRQLQDIAAACPKTKVVLGGYSQGAAVAAYITTDAVPPGHVLPTGITGPLSASVANHVAAVALFGKPSSGFLNVISSAAPPITIGRRYQSKTVDLCIPEDPVCSPTGSDQRAHGQYAIDGMTDQAADFVAHRI